jgi:Na+-driven multidrug efflux pump
MTVIGIFCIAIFPLGIHFYGDQSEFMQSWPPFIILMVSLILSSGYLPFGNIVLQAGFPGRHTFMIFIQVVMNILLNFLLASWLGAIGSAIATGISLLLIIPLLKIFTRKTIGLQI